MIRHSAWNFIEIGKLLEWFAPPYPHVLPDYHQTFAQLVGACEPLNLPHALNTMEQIDAALHHIESQTQNPSLSIPRPEHYQLLSHAVGAADRTLKAEAEARLLAPLNRSAVSAKLLSFPMSFPLTVTQQHLHEEAVLCLETGAYRAAMVMGWNLVFDCLRQWVFSDAARLDAFNGEAAKHGATVHAADYDDFFRIKEWHVLEWCRDARLFGAKIYDRLAHYLRERNDYAHANFTHASVEYATAYINHLLDVILGPPFRT